MKRVAFELHHQGCIEFDYVETEGNSRRRKQQKQKNEKLQVFHQVAPSMNKKYWEMRGEGVTEI